MPVDLTGRTPLGNSRAVAYPSKQFCRKYLVIETLRCAAILQNFAGPRGLLLVQA